MAKILLIEDDDKLRKMLAMLLTMEGYTVSEADNGRQGINTFEKETFDVIITDIFMPEEDGLGVMRTLVKSQPDVKTLVISGGARMGGGMQYLEFARLFGANLTLVKPFENDEFLAAVASLVSS
ncbi:MAG: response regulator [Desulfobacterium sp.]|nr:response regulator [Desulfobacterium sp.]